MGKHNKRNGQNGNHEDRDSVKTKLVSTGNVQATNVMELPIVRWNPSVESNPEVPVLACAHYTIKLSDMWQDSLENHLGEIRRAIKKRAALYYTELSPTTLADITDQVKNVILQSVEVFSIICSAWKHQNCRSFEDEDGFNISSVFSNLTLMSKAISISPTIAWRPFNYAISNSAWKRDILKCLSQIYLPKDTADVLYTLVGHFIQLANDNETCERFISFDANSVSQLNGHGLTLEELIAHLQERVDAIDAAYNKYPFMDELIADFNWIEPGDAYDFTRDLSQLKLKVNSDSANIIADMVYMTADQPANDGVIHESDTVMYRVVRLSGLDGSFLEFYKDDRASAKSLNYNDRIELPIRSMTNALRGNVLPENITYLRVLYTAEGTPTKQIRAINPYGCEAIEAENATVAMLADIIKANNVRDILDMPSDSISLIITGLDTSASELEKITEAVVVANPSSGDYLISEDDIESVISDSAYDVLFGQYPKEGLADQSTVNTLGNNGQNN